MAKMQVTGLEEFSQKIRTLKGAGEAVAKAALYDGAMLMADQIRRNIEALPEDKDRLLKDGEQFDVVSPRDKHDLLEYFGIARMRNDGGQISTLIGFSGYGSRRTAKYPKGLPMLMVARSIESGSSVRRKHPFVRPAVNAVREQVVEKMAETAREQIEKRMEG